MRLLYECSLGHNPGQPVNRPNPLPEAGGGVLPDSATDNQQPRWLTGQGRTVEVVEKDIAATRGLGGAAAAVVAFVRDFSSRLVQTVEYYLRNYYGDLDKRQECLGNESPLVYAMEKRDSKECDRLLRAGANVNYVNDRGYVPLHYAILDCNRDAVDMLIKKGANTSVRAPRGSIYGDYSEPFSITELTVPQFAMVHFPEAVDIIKKTIAL